MTKAILVTGGAGYIGSHACKALATAGYLPVTYDNLSRGNEWAVKWGPLVRGDIRDNSEVCAAIKKYAPEAVMHFAAFGNAGESMQQPQLYWDNNVGGTLSLLTSMHQMGVNKIVFSGSCSVYGNTPTTRITEEAPTGPVSVYGQTKLTGEEMLRDFTRSGHLQAISLRYFNAAGADPDGETGEAHDPEPHLLPNILAAARDGQTLVINGDDYPTKDGTCVRDYIHVTDLANAHVQALRHMEGPQQPLMLFNLGTGTGHSIRECIQAAESVTGQGVSTEFGPRRAGDPAFAVADAGLAQRELDWTPQYPLIHDILETAWNWMQIKNASTTKNS